MKIYNVDILLDIFLSFISFISFTTGFTDIQGDAFKPPIRFSWSGFAWKPLLQLVQNKFRPPDLGRFYYDTNS